MQYSTCDIADRRDIFKVWDIRGEINAGEHKTDVRNVPDVFW
jgi:hypothetical protein